tara:strand:- start:9 stop:593 length:585 start_codon:yes stop_codon:yes gene_type:complete
MKFEIFKFEKVTSTNDVAIYLIKEKNKKTGCIYADVQTKGRGTRGRKWISKEGNLFGSIFFPLKKEYPAFNEFSIINPVLISNVIKKFCKEENISLKWPNDVFVNRKKICGILQELITSKSKKFLIIGIGINVISNPNTNYRYGTTNILLETNENPKLKELINLIISSYENFFLNLNSYNYSDYKKKADLMAMN